MAEIGGDTATFQQTKSEFVGVVKFLIKELTERISQLEDQILMLPDIEVEKRTAREPYRAFRKVFRELFLLTKDTAKDKTLVQAVKVWFTATPYVSETKLQNFTDGVGLSELWLEEMYRLGLLDMQVSDPVDFPFEDIIRDITIEHQRAQALQEDISIDTSCHDDLGGRISILDDYVPDIEKPDEGE
jgi:hypothetical protein